MLSRPVIRLLWLLALCLAAAAQAPVPARTEPTAREVKTYSLTAEQRAKAIELSRARNRLHFAGTAYSILVLVAMLSLRVAPRFRNWAEAVSPRRIVQAYIFGPLLLSLVDVFDLPTEIYGHHLSREFGESVQGWASWMWDWTKGELLQAGFVSLLLWILYGVIRRSPRRWWFYFWLASVPIVIFLMFITPLLVDPLFNRFEPLARTQPRLVAEIGRVVARGGLEIPPGRMYEMNASAKVNTLNAYVSGIGASKRVVVWDTTVRRMTTDEILFVFGHEMGHYVLGHLWVGIGSICLLLLVFLFAVFHVMNWALARWGAYWDIRGPGDWASLTFLMLAAAIVGFLAEPITNSVSRMTEHNADVYGLEVIHGLVPNSAQAAAEAFQILGEVSLSDPDPSPFIRFWLYNHPPIGERVRFAAEYDPWGQGRQPRYVK